MLISSGNPYRIIPLIKENEIVKTYVGKSTINL